MNQAFAHQLGLKTQKTNVGAQKIDVTTLETYRIVVSAFFILDKDGRERFFEESFLLADVKLDVVLGMSFLTISNTDVDFQAQDLQWRFYITGDILLTTRQIELIGKKEFAIAALDLKYKVFVIYVATLSINSDNEVYPLRRAQIAHLKADEALIGVLSEYTDLADIFSPKLATKLPEHIEINDYAIKLVDNEQILYGPIYSLGPVELEILKAYIKNNLANSFIRPSKSPAGVLIFFNKKPDGSIRLYVDY